MAEYIEREAALALVRPDDPTDEKAAVTIATAKKLVRKVLKDTPAADVVPVICGQWIKAKRGQSNQRVCSICKSTVRQPSYDRGEYTSYPHCPYCGAKMRENIET